MDAERLVKVGGKRWQKGDMDRIYFDGLAGWYGLETSRYNSGNIGGATLDGSEISNTKARRIDNDLAQAKVWYDVAEGKFRGKGPNIDDYFATIANRIGAAAEAVEAAS